MREYSRLHLTLSAAIWGALMVAISVVLAFVLAHAITELALATADLVDSVTHWILTEF